MNGESHGKESTCFSIFFTSNVAFASIDNSGAKICLTCSSLPLMIASFKFVNS